MLLANPIKSAFQYFSLIIIIFHLYISQGAITLSQTTVNGHIPYFYSLCLHLILLITAKEPILFFFFFFSF